MLDQISNIPILHVLDKLGVKYRKVGSNAFALYEQGVITDGWKASEVHNIVNDFSGKNRPKGGAFSFVKSYLGLENKETFERFVHHFGIQISKKEIKKNKNYYRKEESTRHPPYHANW